MKTDIQLPELPAGNFFDSLLNIAKEAATVQQTPNSLCVNQSRTVNYVRAEIHIVNQPRPGIIRRLLSRIF